MVGVLRPLGHQAAFRSRCVRRVVLCACCVPVALLAGCPDAGGSAGKIPAQKTAPAIDARGAAGLGTAQQSAEVAQRSADAGQRGAPTAAGQQASATPALSGEQLVAAQEEARKVQALTQQVDKSYASGVQNYRAGRLDAARLDFDFAVDLMLTSGLDIKADPALNDEFEQTVNAVNSLEMDALKQGNGF